MGKVGKFIKNVAAAEGIVWVNAIIFEFAKNLLCGMTTDECMNECGWMIAAAVICVTVTGIVAYAIDVVSKSVKN